jgi:cytochrome-b5 reductase
VANFREQRKQEFERLVQDEADKNGRKRQRKYKIWHYGWWAIVVPLTAILFWYNHRLEDGVFIDDLFMPFTITKREYVSSTAFILTVRPKQGPSNRTAVDPYKGDWEKGGWTVRLAQPEMQIARVYTPLPPSGSDKPDELRFLVRKVKGGEVSTYLSRLPIGAKVLVQRWYPSVDTIDLKNTTDILFLAGGTGIAPAMQLAYALFEGQTREDGGPKMHIVWGNQRREDCLGGRPDTRAFNEGRGKNRIVAELENLQRKHPERLSIEYVVDEERTFIDERILQQNISPSPPSNSAAKLICVCGSEGFMRHVAGSTLDDDKINGHDTRKSTIISGGVLSRINVAGWDILKLP